MSEQQNESSQGKSPLNGSEYRQVPDPTPKPPPMVSPPPASSSGGNRPPVPPLIQPIVCPYARRRSFGCIGFAVILLLLLIVLPFVGTIVFSMIAGFFAQGMESIWKTLPEESMVNKIEMNRRVMTPGKSDKEIAVVNIKGVISNSRRSGNSSTAGDICQVLEMLAKRPSVSAIILNMDTPGGELVASDDIYEQVLACREAGKKVITRIHGMGASGGYYIAAGSDWIVSHRMALTGSIGVIMASINIQDLAGKVGIRPVVIKSGGMKDMMSSMREMTEEERKYLQSHIDSAFTEFATIVGKGRSQYGDIEAVKAAEFADGRVLTGQRAYELGLVDELGGLQVAVKKAEELGDCEGATVAIYSKKFDFFTYLLEMRARGGVADVVRSQPALLLEPGRLYLLSPSVLGLSEE
ncbi:MAG: signal peptide peptidase SppA [Lentisphaerae bacterium]|jgi:protease-4|nr:signal peptide peptidase SppA [Lentisphaerota bacterium]